jgi:hypothetical protein
MQYAQSPPLVDKEWPTAEDLASDVRPRDVGARLDQRKRPNKASVDSHYAFARKGDPVANDRPSVGRRIFRSFSRFSIAAFSGVPPRLPGSPMAMLQGRCWQCKLRRWRGWCPSQ